MGLIVQVEHGGLGVVVAHVVHLQQRTIEKGYLLTGIMFVNCIKILIGESYCTTCSEVTNL